jgi:anti-sigma B factor antagonist
LDIVLRDGDSVVVVVVKGEIDMETAPVLREAIILGIGQTPGKPCVLDLTAVTFLGSAGLATLAEATQHAQALREPLRIVVDSNRPVIRPIQVSGLDDMLSLYHSVDEATRSGTERQGP